jgi:F-type H+-transporting ATPase subunit b
MADPLPEVVTANEAETVAETGHGGAPVHVEPELFGMAPFQIVALAMLILILIMVWKRVPGMITGGIDGKIAAIRQQLDEAKALRAEAEQLRAEYAAKIAGAEKDAESLLANARHEAEFILDKAKTDSEEVVARRERMATDKIAAAEREAVDQVKARAAEAATVAARKLIAENHAEDADRKLADEIIAGI